MDVDYAELRAQYLLFADKHNIVMQVAKLGFKEEKQQPGKVAGADAIAWSHFAFEITLSKGVKTLSNKPKADYTGYETVINPGPNGLTFSYHCGEAVPMTDDVVVNVARRIMRGIPNWELGNTPANKAAYRSFGRISLAQDRINKAFIEAATKHYEPMIVDILSCVKSDLSMVYEEDMGFVVTFEDFCEEMGGNLDSIKEKKAFDATVAQSQGLVRLLGLEATKELLALEGL